jgi:hypothetical protein
MVALAHESGADTELADTERHHFLAPLGILDHN